MADSLRSLPETIIKDFEGKLEAFCSKYETTFDDIEKEIADTERSIIGMLDTLIGSEFDMAGLIEFRKLLEG